MLPPIKLKHQPGQQNKNPETTTKILSIPTNCKIWVTGYKPLQRDPHDINAYAAGNEDKTWGPLMTCYTEKLKIAYKHSLEIIAVQSKK